VVAGLTHESDRSRAGYSHLRLNDAKGIGLFGGVFRRQPRARRYGGHTGDCLHTPSHALLCLVDVYVRRGVEFFCVRILGAMGPFTYRKLILAMADFRVRQRLIATQSGRVQRGYGPED
jgi:hypothetical protein